MKRLNYNDYSVSVNGTRPYPIAVHSIQENSGPYAVCKKICYKVGRPKMIKGCNAQQKHDKQKVERSFAYAFFNTLIDKSLTNNLNNNEFNNNNCHMFYC